MEKKEDENLGNTGIEWNYRFPLPGRANLTVERLDAVLRMCGIEINKTILKRIIDAVELIERKGGDVTLSDVVDMESRWEIKNE